MCRNVRKVVGWVWIATAVLSSVSCEKKPREAGAGSGDGAREETIMTRVREGGGVSGEQAIGVRNVVADVVGKWTYPGGGYKLEIRSDHSIVGALSVVMQETEESSSGFRYEEGNWKIQWDGTPYLMKLSINGIAHDIAAENVSVRPAYTSVKRKTGDSNVFVKQIYAEATIKGSVRVAGGVIEVVCLAKVGDEVREVVLCNLVQRNGTLCVTPVHLQRISEDCYVRE